MNIDTLRSVELVNRKQFYVSISRARDGVTIYTDDREALRHAVNRNREKSVALEQARYPSSAADQAGPGSPAQDHQPSPRNSSMSGHQNRRPSAMSAGTSGFASFAARHAAPRAARAPRRSAKEVALATLATAPPALSRRALRLSRLQRSAARISESCAALQIRLRGRRFQCCAGPAEPTLAFGQDRVHLLT